MTSRPSFLALAVLALLPRPPAAQDASENREIATLAEEQALLQRQIQRLRGTMELLLERIAAEGRTHTADLIQKALKELDERSAADELAPMTVEERMDAARSALDQGRLAQSLEHQERLVAELERLLAILMDRENMQDLEDRLARLRAFDEALDALADEEGKLRGETEELRESSASEAARELERRLASLSDGQRKLLERTEELGRETGTAELEQISRELERLIEDQRTDAEVLAAYDPAELARLDALREALAEALREEVRAERLAAAGEEIRRAGNELPSASAEEREAARTRLAEASERAESQARVSKDPSLEKSARALKAALGELERAAREGTERASATGALEELERALEEEAERARERAEARRGDAGRGLSTGRESNVPSPTTQELERLLKEASEARAKGANAEARAATELANEAWERARTEQVRLGQALAGSQTDSAERAERLERSLSSLNEGKSPEGAEARAALGEAAEDMRSAAERTRNGKNEEAARAANEAVQALERSRAALERAREAAQRGSGLQRLASEQGELARELDELRELPSQADLDEGARSEVERSLEEARRAMEEAGTELAQGSSSSAARSEREALEALRKAGASTRMGVRPRSAEDDERAQELAEEQERIRREILDLARRIQEEEQELDARPLERAESAAERASNALGSGGLSTAEEAQREAERELRRQREELQQEEERYQRLRAEELLFRLGEELTAMLETHRAQMEAVVEIQADRSDEEEPSRSVKLRLRGIAREEQGLSSRAKEMSSAIEKEGARVSAQMLANAASDLTRISELLSEAGDYRTGERTQALQLDVEDAFERMLESLHAEQKRREQGQQEPPPQSGEPPPNGQEPLVPDSAELKLLRRMEVDLQESVDQLLALHPELRGPVEDLDPDVLRDITRLAGRHEAITVLFRSMRERLGIDAPQAETSPRPEAPPQEEGE